MGVTLARGSQREGSMGWGIQRHKGFGGRASGICGVRSEPNIGIAMESGRTDPIGVAGKDVGDGGARGRHAPNNWAWPGGGGRGGARAP